MGVLLFFEKQRAEAAQSEECKARRMRRTGGGFNVLVA
jgi:hypothetical protein